MSEKKAGGKKSRRRRISFNLLSFSSERDEGDGLEDIYAQLYKQALERKEEGNGNGKTHLLDNHEVHEEKVLPSPTPEMPGLGLGYDPFLTSPLREASVLPQRDKYYYSDDEEPGWFARMLTRLKGLGRKAITALWELFMMLVAVILFIGSAVLVIVKIAWRKSRLLVSKLSTPELLPWVVLVLVLCTGAAFPLVGESATATISGGVIATLGIVGAIIFFTPWRKIASWRKKRLATPPPIPPSSGGGDSGGGGSNSSAVPSNNDDIIESYATPEKRRNQFIWCMAVLLPFGTISTILWVLLSPLEMSVAERAVLSLGCGFTWIILYLFWGFTIIPQNQFIGVERLGKFHSIRKGGMHVLCFHPLIDKIHPRTKKEDSFGSYSYKRVELYTREGGTAELIDFKDGSSNIVGEAFYRVQHGKEPHFMYSLEDPEERIKTLLDDLVRSVFQSYKIQDALLVRGAVWDEAQKKTEYKDIKTELEQAGVELDTRRGIVISDITLPDELVRLRQLKLQGESKAAQEKALGDGYAKKIRVIARQLGITPQEAIYFAVKQQLVDSLPNTKANITLVDTTNQPGSPPILVGTNGGGGNS